MPAPTFLLRDRHGGYLFRRLIPLHLREHLGHRREIRRSLRTHHRPTAVLRARALAVHFDLLFAKLTAMAKKDYQSEIQQLQQKVERAKKLHREITAEGDPDFTLLAEINVELEEEEALPLIEDAKFKANQIAAYETEQRRQLLLREAEIENGLPLGSLSGSSTALTAPKTNPVSEAPKLSSIFGDFKVFKLGGKSIRETTFDEYQTALDDLIFVCGDVPVDEITFEHACTFRETCQRLPKHRNKIEGLKGKTCSELLALNTPRSRNLSARTVSDRLGYLQTIYDWLVARRIVENNPFSEVSLAYEKNPYPLLTATDLQDIFNSPLYTDSAYSRLKTTSAAYWWFPLLSLWSGARPSELAQLRTNDVKEIEGILAAEVVDDEETEQRAKTEAGQRIFPIHPILIDLGFEEYLQRVRKAGLTRIFESIPLGTRKAGETVGKWYNERYRATHLPARFKDERKALYCFRCTYITEALNAGIPLRDLQQMVGHEKSIMGATKHYDRGQKLGALRDEIEKITFPKLDLSHLKGGWAHLLKL